MSKSFNEKLINDVFEENKDKVSLSLSLTVTFGQHRVGESSLGLGFDENGCFILSAVKAELTSERKVRGMILARRSNPKELGDLFHTEAGIKIRNFIKQEVMKRLESM